MSSFLYFIRLALALVCLVLSIFIIYQGQTWINLQKANQEQAAENSQKEQTDAKSRQDQTENQAENKSAELLAELEKQSADLNNLNTSFEKLKSTATTELQNDQGEITKGNEAYQILTNMVAAIVKAKDDRLTALLAKDVEKAGFKINIPAQTGATPDLPQQNIPIDHSVLPTPP